MDDLQCGKRNKRGDWTPNAPVGTAPLFVFPPQPLALLKWLPSYFLPYNLLFAGLTLAWWRWVLPDVDTMKTFEWGWILRLFIVNCVAVFLFFGAFELRLYVFRTQGTRFKYNGKWPAEQRSKAFFFQRQNIDNMVRTFGTGLPIWTAIEVVILHAFATGAVRWLSFAGESLVFGISRADRSRHPRDALLSLAPRHSLGSALSVGSLGPPQLGEPVAMVVALDASGRATRLPGCRVLAPAHSVEPDPRSLPAALRRLRRNSWPRGLRQSRAHRGDGRR